MKEEAPILYPNDIVGRRISLYAEDKTSHIPQYIIDYHVHVRETQPATANYMISISQAQAMVFLARMIEAERVLEIGVYVGLSSLAWSHAVGPGGRVTGLESDLGYAEKAREYFSQNRVGNVDIIGGDAVVNLPKLEPEEPYDIIFIDAQKSGYPTYLSRILEKSQPGDSKRLLRPGGIIIGDNVLRCGLVADDSECNPWRKYDFGPHRKEYWKSEDIKSLRDYNDAIIDCKRLENWLCPLWDGVNIARLLD